MISDLRISLVVGLFRNLQFRFSEDGFDHVGGKKMVASSVITNTWNGGSARLGLKRRRQFRAALLSHTNI